MAWGFLLVSGILLDGIAMCAAVGCSNVVVYQLMSTHLSLKSAEMTAGFGQLIL